MKRSTIIMLALGVCMMMAFTSEPSKTTEKTFTVKQATTPEEWKALTITEQEAIINDIEDGTVMVMTREGDNQKAQIVWTKETKLKTISMLRVAASSAVMKGPTECQYAFCGSPMVNQCIGTFWCCNSNLGMSSCYPSSYCVMCM